MFDTNMFGTKAVGMDLVDSECCNLICYSNWYLTNYIITAKIRKCK